MSPRAALTPRQGGLFAVQGNTQTQTPRVGFALYANRPQYPRRSACQTSSFLLPTPKFFTSTERIQCVPYKAKNTHPTPCRVRIVCEPPSMPSSLRLPNILISPSPAPKFFTPTERIQCVPYKAKKHIPHRVGFALYANRPQYPRRSACQTSISPSPAPKFFTPSERIQCVPYRATRRPKPRVYGSHCMRTVPTHRPTRIKNPERKRITP